MCSNVCYILTSTLYSGLSVLKNCFEICGISYTHHFGTVSPTDINRLLLQDINHPQETCGPLPQGWLDTQAAHKACDRIETLVSQQKSSFVVADTMFCKTLPVWLQVLQKKNIKREIIQIIRHPYEVAMSLQKYENIETRKGFLIWFSHIYTTLQYKHAQIVITLDQLIADPVTTLDKVLDGNVINPYISYSNLLNIAQPSLKNHHASSFLDRDKKYFKPFAHIYDQLRAGQKNIETNSGIIDTLLYALSQNQTTTCQFLNKKTQITSDTLITLQAKVFLPSLKGETGIANTISLIKDQWQKIELSITESDLLKKEKICINLLNTKGSVLISSVKLLNQASQEIVWQADTGNALEIIEFSDDLILLNHEETLGFIVAGENSKIYLPVLDTVSDIPLILQFWIKPSLEQVPLMKSWHKEVMSTSKNQTEHNIPKKIYRFNSKFKYFFHAHYHKSNKCFLTQLCDLHGTDKGSFRTAGHPYRWKPHTYSDFYAMMFYPIRLNVRCLFECGIGTNNTEIEANMTVNGIPGASLRVWRDFFPNAQIIGADIDREVLFTEERITTYYIDQTDSESVIAFWKATDIKTVDIIIDDGLHISQAGICLFENSIDYLSEYGIYIIEDVKEQYLFDYKEYFDNLDKYFVFFINMFRPYAGLGDNNIIMIQKNSHLASNN